MKSWIVNEHEEYQSANTNFNFIVVNFYFEFKVCVLTECRAGPFANVS